MIESFEKLVLTLQKIADDASGLPGIFMSKTLVVMEPMVEYL